MNAVTTLKIGEPWYAKYTEPFIKRYAEKIGADYVPITEFKNIGGVPSCKTEVAIYYEKFQLFDILEKYDRVIFFDLDILVQPWCPNLFEIVPDDKLGASVIGHISGHIAEPGMIALQDKIGIKGFPIDRYLCTGLMVLSQCHKEAFDYNDPRWQMVIDKQVELGIWHNDQDAMNLIFFYCGFMEKLFDLGTKKNQFIYFDITRHNLKSVYDKMNDHYDWNDRLQANVIHYAGQKAKKCIKFDAVKSADFINNLIAKTSSTD